MNKNFILASAVAAMLAASCPSSRAQDATMAPPAMPGAMANPGTLSSGSMSGMTPSGGIDFSVLNNSAYDYTDIKKAKAEGFSDSDVATIAKIARLTGYSFTSLTDRVLHGTTFSTLAEESNLNLGDVLNAQDEKDKISAYEAAYEATGSMALKNMGMMPNMAAATTTMTPDMMMPMDIVATAMKDGRFKTLVRELKRADLVSALQGTGPFTVFAPTDDAFKKLPKGALKDLENNPSQLAAVLKYHVIAARVDAATAMAMTSPTSPPTLEGGTLQVTSGGGSVKINDATVVQADIQTSNGIIHAIDLVLMPSDLSTMTGTAGTDTTGMTTPSTDTSTTTTTTTTTTPAQ